MERFALKKDTYSKRRGGKKPSNGFRKRGREKSLKTVPRGEAPKPVLRRKEEDASFSRTADRYLLSILRRSIRERQ